MTEDKKQENTEEKKIETPEIEENVSADVKIEDMDLGLAEEDSKEKKEKKVKPKPAKGKGKKKRKEKKIAPSGRAYIKATYNNTIVSLTDQNGDVLSWSNAGICGFKGPKKATPYAAQTIVKQAVEKAKNYGLKEVVVFVKGVGTGRESAVRALNANGLNILSIKDLTPIPHNGCRPKKPRRV